MTGWLLCVLGRHDWNQFGECRRDWKHVQMYPGEWLTGAGHFMHGTEWSDGPWTRVANRKHEAKREAGLELQARMREAGADVTLELCKDVAQHPVQAAAMLEIARERTARRLARSSPAPTPASETRIDKTSQADIHVTLTRVDRLTPELHRVRYHFLTPIGRRIPPRGTMEWQFMELHVRFRQLGRALVQGIPGASAVPWAEVGRVWVRRLEWLGVAYLIVAGIAAVLLLTGVIR